jgi:hypothetical protein
MKTRAPIRASPPRTPITTPAIDPPLSLDPPAALASADAESAPALAPEVEVGSETVIVLTWPPELVSNVTLPEVVVLDCEVVD